MSEYNISNIEKKNENMITLVAEYLCSLNYIFNKVSEFNIRYGFHMNKAPVPCNLPYWIVKYNKLCTWFWEADVLKLLRIPHVEKMPVK